MPNDNDKMKSTIKMLTNAKKERVKKRRERKKERKREGDRRNMKMKETARWVAGISGEEGSKSR